MRDLQVIDITPVRLTSTKRLAGAGAGGGARARVVRLTVRMLRGHPLSRAMIQAQSGVSRATAMRDLRVVVDTVRWCGVRVTCSAGVYSVAAKALAGDPAQ